MRSDNATAGYPYLAIHGAGSWPATKAGAFAADGSRIASGRWSVSLAQGNLIANSSEPANGGSNKVAEPRLADEPPCELPNSPRGCRRKACLDDAFGKRHRASRKRELVFVIPLAKVDHTDGVLGRVLNY